MQIVLPTVAECWLKQQTFNSITGSTRTSLYDGIYARDVELFARCSELHSGGDISHIVRALE